MYTDQNMIETSLKTPNLGNAQNNKFVQFLNLSITFLNKFFLNKIYY